MRIESRLHEAYSLGARSSLSEGARGPEVKKLQQELERAGIDPGAREGVFDADTTDAVKEFQRKHRLPVTGVADPQTREVLERPASERPTRPNRAFHAQDFFQR